MKTRIALGIGSFLLFILCPGVASAESSAPVSREVTKTFERILKETRNTAYKNYRMTSRGPVSETEGVDADPVTLEAGQANGKGTLTLKRSRDCTVLKSCWSVKVSAPTSKDAEQTDFTNLDGLAKDLTLTFDWRKSPISEAGLDDFFSDLDDLCNTLGLISSCDDALIGRAIRLKRSIDLIKQNKRIRHYAQRASSTWFVKGKLSVNHYKFFNLGDEESKSIKMGASLKVGYARIAGNGRLSVSGAWQRSFKESETKAQLCQAVGTTGTLESCKTLPFGSPQRINSPMLQVEYRRHFKDFAVSPLISYDLEQDVTGIELPIYLVRDNKGILTGGFKFGWRSDKDELSGSIFVAKPFKLLGR